jgi:hypothetical protein
MKILTGMMAGVMGAAFAASVALANPALLPKHPGYPASGNANDQGQTNAGGDKALQDSISSTDNHVQQNLQDPNRARIKTSQGAGRLPDVDGPQVRVEPPVTSATKIGTDRIVP